MKIRYDKTALKLVLVLVCSALAVFAGLSLDGALDNRSDGRENIPSSDSDAYSDSVSLNADSVKPDSKDTGTIRDNYASDDGDLTYYGGEWYKAKEKLDTLLLMGVDKFVSNTLAAGEAYSNTQQADFFLLLVFDKQNKKYTALHINRDTMTDIRVFGVTGDDLGTKKAQLALSHTYGSGKEDSCEYSAQAVSHLLYGVPIKKYAAVTMDAIPILNDSVGGVEVLVEDDFSAIHPEFVVGERVTLRGNQALTYVRSRSGVGDSTNLSRMRRQRDYLAALLGKMKSGEYSEDKFTSTVFEVNEYLTSDCTVTELSDYYSMLCEYEMTELRELEGNAVKGEEFIEFYVDDTKLGELVMDLFYEKSERK